MSQHRRRRGPTLPFDVDVMHKRLLWHGSKRCLSDMQQILWLLAGLRIQETQ